MASDSSTRPTGRLTGFLEAIRVDLVRLHGAWMELLFDRQLEPVHPTLGKWRPETFGEKIGYYAWGVLGALALVVAYPLTVFGFAVRAYAGRLRNAAVALGFLGVILVTAVVWGLLTAATYLAAFPWDGVLAVAVGGAVATVSAGLAVVFAYVDGRATTVLLAYPFAFTAVFLPPVVAAFYSPTLAAMVFPGSTSLATWILDNLLAFWGLAAYLRATFDLIGLGYVAMWIALSFPVGWFLGLVVSAANLVRPAESTDPMGS
jgi:hypothetical protein